MANTQSLCTSFLGELLTGTHNFGAAPIRAAATADTFRAALYLTTATVNATKATYGGTVGSVADSGEVTGTNYTAGGVIVTNATAPLSTNSSPTAGTAYWTPSAAIQYGSVGVPVTLATSFDAVLIFNNTQGNKAVSVHTFGAQTVTAGIFSLTMPTNSTTTALVRIATV